MNRVITFFLIISLFIAAAGCEGPADYTPKIVGRDSLPAFKVKPVVTPSNNTTQTSQYQGVSGEWIPPKSCEKSWKAIVVHHSATHTGNAAIFDQWHRNGNHWQGVGYDFVIGNGSKSSDGQVEVTFRWKQQIPGAHVGGTPNNWANEDGIGICLVGDFNNSRPTTKQMQSLVKLIRFLQQRYNIPTSRIYGHCDTPGYTGNTECPGKFFSMWQLKKML